MGSDHTWVYNVESTKQTSAGSRGFNRGGASKKRNKSTPLYIKEVKGYTPPYSIEKNYYRVDKKITS